VNEGPIDSRDVSSLPIVVVVLSGVRVDRRLPPEWRIGAAPLFS